MFQKINIVFIIITLLLGLAGPAKADTISFTAGDIVHWMALQGAPLHKSSVEHGDEVWGINRVRVIPEVSVPAGYTSPGYTINLNSSFTTQTDWRVQFDYTGNPPYGLGNGSGAYGTYAAFNDIHTYSWNGSFFTGGNLYMISDLSQADFASKFPEHLSGTQPDLHLKKVADDAVFSFDFTLDPGVTRLNQGFYFVVDGYWYNTWYHTDTYDNPIAFTGGFAHNMVTTAGNLPGNMDYGYNGNVPIPGSVVLLGSGLLGLAWVRLRRR